MQNTLADATFELHLHQMIKKQTNPETTFCHGTSIINKNQTSNGGKVRAYATSLDFVLIEEMCVFGGGGGVGGVF